MNLNNPAKSLNNFVNDNDSDSRIGVIFYLYRAIGLAAKPRRIAQRFNCMM